MKTGPERRWQGRHKYVPNLKRLQATCDVNYASILKLLPELDEQDLTYTFADDGRLSMDITIIDCARYTTTLELRQRHKGLPSFVQPRMQVRLYHDMRMAEVLQSQNMGAFKPSYAYPNKRMMQRNEKEMVNLFLTEWLHFCEQHRQQTGSEKRE